MHPEVERQGYRVVRGVLSSSEILSARASVMGHLRRARFHSHLGAHELNASVRVPELSWLFAHEGVVAAVRESLGGAPVRFTLHSDLGAALLE